MSRVLAWLDCIASSGALPIVECQFEVNNETLTGFVNSHIVNRMVSNHGVVLLDYDISFAGNIIIQDISNFPDIIDYRQHQQFLNVLDDRGLTAYQSFLAIMSMITHPHLEPFVSFWQQHPRVLEVFFTIGASTSHHHAYKSGLLIHSVETVRNAYALGKSARLSDEHLQLLMVASLFHDIGKVFPVVYGNAQDYIPSDHECLNYCLLETPIKALVQSNSSWFEVLSMALKPYKANERCQISSIVRNADKQSCEDDLAKQLECQLPVNHFFKRRNGYTFKRPF